ncbi:MAG: CBS domain-containing protein, partial [Rectinemataceae bacterium]|nr:CBS domain-containing protein [Rectinemataceae bacterium]
VPKAIALRDPTSVALKAAKWFALLDRLFSPIVTIFESSTKLLLKLLFRRDRKQAEVPPVTSSEMAEHLDGLSPQHRTYVLNLVNIENKKIRDIMLPWKQVVYVNIVLTASEVEAVVISSGHTRLPVVQDGKAIGVLNTKEFVALAKTGETDWRKMIRPYLHITESDSLLRALRLMQERRSHLAVVTSGTDLVGIVTLEDIIEEVIGDVYDEDDDGALLQILSSSPKIRSMRSTVK